jgi:putative tryptophan/tyrosine transport system substrate-binding protein
MQRREFIGTFAGGVVAASLPTRLLGDNKVPRIGSVLLAGGEPLFETFVKALQDLGYFEGKNIKIERRIIERWEQASEKMADLVNLGVDVIVAAGPAGGFFAKKATSKIPIVVVASHDGVGAGLYGSLSHPGANITGIDSMAPELDVKRVQMLKQIVPHLSSLTVLYNPTFPGAKNHLETIATTAEKLGIAVRVVEVRTISDFEPAFGDILQHPTDAVIPINDSLILITGRKRIIDFAAEHGIPMFHEFKIMVEQGALVSYGPDITEMWRRGAYYVDKILKGERPGDIPVEQPTKFNLAINLKTAKVLGLTFPDDLLATADEVIE